MLRHGGVSSSSDDDQETEEEEDDDEVEDDAEGNEDQVRARAVLASLPAVAGGQQTNGGIRRVSIAESSNVTVATQVINVFHQAGPVASSPAPPAPAPRAAPSWTTMSGAAARTSPPPVKNCSPLRDNVFVTDSPAPWKETGKAKHSYLTILRMSRYKQAITLAALCLVISGVSVIITMYMFYKPPPENGEIITTPSPTAAQPAVLGLHVNLSSRVTMVVGQEWSRSRTGWLPQYFGICVDEKSGSCRVISIRNVTDSSAFWCACYTSRGLSITQPLSDGLACSCQTALLVAPLPDTLRFVLHFDDNADMMVGLSGRKDLVMSATTYRAPMQFNLRVAAESGSLCFSASNVTDGQAMLVGRPVSVGYVLPFLAKDIDALYIGMCHPCGGTCTVVHLEYSDYTVMYRVLQSHTNSYLRSGDIISEAQPTNFPFAFGGFTNTFVIELLSPKEMMVTIREWNLSITVSTLPGQTVLRVDSAAGCIIKL